MQESLILPNLLNTAQYCADLPWQPFRPGVDIHWLYQDDRTQSQAALLRYQPGAAVPKHEHLGYEHIIVLSGSQSDRQGTYSAGTMIVNPPQSDHEVSSAEGCIVLIIWNKPVKIFED